MNSATGIVMSLERKEEVVFVSILTQYLNKELKLLERSIQISFSTQNSTMTPIGEYEQNCMIILEQYTDHTILIEENDEIREAYFIGKLIDVIAYDLISKTHITRYYKQGFDFESENLN